MNNNKSSGGIGFIGVLTAIFVAFKLAKVVSWSWVWVLSPIWISLLLVIAIAVIMYIWSD